MASKKTAGGVSTGAVVGAAAAAAAAAAGAYWFYGAKDAAKHRKSARSFMLKARSEVLEAVETVVDKVGDIDKAKYMQIVDSVVKRYANMQGVTPAEKAEMVKDLQAAWAHMHKAGMTATKSVKKAVVKNLPKAKKAAKKKR